MLDSATVSCTVLLGCVESIADLTMARGLSPQNDLLCGLLWCTVAIARLTSYREAHQLSHRAEKCFFGQGVCEATGISTVVGDSIYTPLFGTSSLAKQYCTLHWITANRVLPRITYTLSPHFEDETGDATIVKMA